jgi:molecular chaperone DnaK
MGHAVGIDLGTTFSVVAALGADGRPEAIRDASGSATVPSVVYLGGPVPVVGAEAKERQALGEPDVAAFFKRQMGEPRFALTARGRRYSAVDLSALVLAHMKSVAEAALKGPVTDAVITVPAYFNNVEREATLRAGRAAGLNVLGIINEPTAAALAYGLKADGSGGTFLVFDLGGGTFDVTIARLGPDSLQVLGTSGDHQLGGKDWDDVILRDVAQRFQEEFGTDLFESGFSHLLPQAEEAKKALSVKERVPITVDAAGHRATYILTREGFAEASRDLLERAQALTGQLLQELNLTWQDLSAVLLVGGSTRMPMVAEWLTRITGRPPERRVNPDEAVALGAALQASLQATPRLLPGVRKVVDVMSHSLGMIALSADGERYINSVIVARNLPIPARHARPYRLTVRPGEPVTLEAYVTQGESEDPQACAYLGLYVLTGEPGPGGDVIVDVSYAYDSNGVVQVSACERSTGAPLSLTVKPLPEDVPARFAGPPEQARRVEPVSIYLAVDLSGSMSGRPLREAQKAAHEFLAQCDLTSMSVGLIGFSDTVKVLIPPSQNGSEIARRIERLKPGLTGIANAAEPFTAILELAADIPHRRHAVVLTDGVWLDQKGAIGRAQRCHAAGISVLGVGFGKADRDFLEKISSPGLSGIFTDLDHLAEAFSHIAQEFSAGSRLGAAQSPLAAPAPDLTLHDRRAGPAPPAAARNGKARRPGDQK